MYRIPLPVPTFPLESFPDETGFTTTEKIALNNARVLITPKIEEYALEFFLSYFTQNEELLNHFRNKNGELQMEKLHSHPYKIFKVLETLIIEGLEDKVQLHSILFQVATSHLNKNVESEVLMMAQSLKDFLKLILEKVMSPTLERSINKICDLLINIHSSSEENS